MGKPRIFISVQGGLIQTIVADQPVDMMVLDCDVEGFDKYKVYKDLDGKTFEAFPSWDKVRVDKEFIEHFFKQKNKKRKNESKTNLQDN